MMQRLQVARASAAASAAARYEKKSPIEHVLLRPGMYIGSVERSTTSTWTIKHKAGKAVGSHFGEVKYVPGLLKVFDEVLVNAMDNAARDPDNMTTIAVNIDDGASGNPASISVANDGRGIPVVEHPKEKVLVPELVFGHLLTGSNFDDTQERLGGGRHGYGAKLTNIFSNQFVVETVDSEHGRSYRQEWRDNMGAMEPAELGGVDDAAAAYNEAIPPPPGAPANRPTRDFTRVSFLPDLPRFGRSNGKIDRGTLTLMQRRVVDAAAVCPNIRVLLNGVEVPVNTFQDFCQLHTSGHLLVMATRRGGWELGATFADPDSKTGPAQVISFVNGIRTDRGGTHATAVVDALASKMAAILTKKHKGHKFRPAMIKPLLRLMLNCRVPNPNFDSQAKEQLTTPVELPESLVTDALARRVLDTGVEEAALEAVVAKERADTARELRKVTKNNAVRIPKLEDAHLAGSKRGHECTLILTEGDSAKALAVAGLGVVGRQRYGVFPLRGKLLNVRDLDLRTAIDNHEVAALIAILGLDFQKTYEGMSLEERPLRYGRVMIMTDQDIDGSHIKGLVANLFHTYWPALLQGHTQDAAAAADGGGFLEQFVTPLIKVRKGSQTKEFFSMAAYEAWREEVGDPTTPTGRGWRVKYYKGLGTSTSAEGRAYFSDLQKHRVPFCYGGEEDDDRLSMAFSKDRAADRRDWLERTWTKAAGQAIADGTDDRAMTFQEFVDDELVEFSKADVVRSIPSVLDGLKPSQRKVLYACFKREGVRAGRGAEIKVAQLGGYVAETTAYHHGEQSLVSTMVNMAQDFVGSNNLPLLQPIGQFGTRLNGGRDHASARYIHTRLSKFARLLFPAEDDELLPRVLEDSKPVEPQHYLPVIPMSLVNGAEGIGTGWATSIPAYNPLQIVDRVAAAVQSFEDAHGLAADADPDSLPKHMAADVQLAPWVKDFKGHIRPVGTRSKRQGFESVGVVKELTRNREIEKLFGLKRRGKRAIATEAGCNWHIEELPVGVWTDSYKQWLHSLVDKGLVDTVRERHTEVLASFAVRLTHKGAEQCSRKGPEAFFRLERGMSTSNMHLIDSHGRPHKYEEAEDVIAEFLPYRMSLYFDRKATAEAQLGADQAKAAAKSFFLEAVRDGSLQLTNRPVAEVEAQLREMQLPTAQRLKAMANPFEDESPEPLQEGEEDFGYLVDMPISQLTAESMKRAQTAASEASDKLETLRGTSAAQLWLRDLADLRAALVKLGGFEANQHVVTDK